MNKLFVAALVIASTSLASPVYAQKRSEYNFNTCNYNFYGNGNPMNGQGAAGGPVNFYKGVGVTGTTTERLRANMSSNASIYQQTPQRTRTVDNLGFNRVRKVTNQQQQQQLPQQQPGYLYVPGQNTNTVQTSTQCSVGFQNKSGALQYTTSDTTTNANSNSTANRSR